MGKLVGAQVRMARGHLRWSVLDLSNESGVPVSTIKRIELSDGVPTARATSIDALHRALVSAGIVFVPENGAGPGVRLRKVQKRSK